jgi:hypothetical protein
MLDWLGQQFGSYLLTDLLGQGGFANVYLGEHVRYGTQAAIRGCVKRPQVWVCAKRLTMMRIMAR